MPSREQIGNTCRNRLQTEIVVPFTYPTQYDNIPEPAHTGVWLRASVLFGVSNQVQIPAWYRTIGVFLIQIRQPIDLGDQALLQVADRIVAVFKLITVSGVTFRTPSVETFGRDGPYWLVNVKCPFISDESS